MGQAEGPDVNVARLRATIGRLARQLRPTVAGAGLTPSQISALFTIVRHGPIGLSRLADIEAMNPTMVSRITAGLCERGLIERQALAEDRRAATVSATAAGKRLREQVHRERTRALKEYLEGFDEREQQLLWDALPVLEELGERMRR